MTNPDRQGWMSARLLRIGCAVILFAAVTASCRPTAEISVERPAAPPVAKPATIIGKVIRVTDGDTIVVLVDEQQHRVRLIAIDTPEMGQPFGKAAKKFTSDFSFGETVELINKGTDQYDRVLAEVFVDGEHLNRELLRAGLAWHFKKYDQNPELAVLENEARAAKHGLWAVPEPVAPWDWRRLNKEERDLLR